MSNFFDIKFEHKQDGLLGEALLRENIEASSFTDRDALLAHSSINNDSGHVMIVLRRLFGCDIRYGINFQVVRSSFEEVARIVTRTTAALATRATGSFFLTEYGENLRLACISGQVTLYGYDVFWKDYLDSLDFPGKPTIVAEHSFPSEF